MELEQYSRGRVTVISLTGELDSNSAPTVHSRLVEAVPDDGGVLLDLSGTSYMSSAGLRVLLLMSRQARARRATVALAQMPADVREVMAATGFLDFFLVADTVDDGVQALGG
jgi:anti-anti-sigma factor